MEQQIECRFEFANEPEKAEPGVTRQWKYTSWYGRILTFMCVPAMHIRACSIHYQMAPPLGDSIATGRCGDGHIGGPDPGYPHLKSVTIGEFGMNYIADKVCKLSNSNDFINYGGNPWVLSYTYRALVNGINRQPPSVLNNVTAASNLI